MEKLSDFSINQLKTNLSFLYFLFSHWLDVEFKDTLIKTVLFFLETNPIQIDAIERIKDVGSTITKSLLRLFESVFYRVIVNVIKSTIFIVLNTIHFLVFTIIFSLLLFMKLGLNLVYPLLNNLVIHVFFLTLVPSAFMLLIALPLSILDPSARRYFVKALSDFVNGLQGLWHLGKTLLLSPISTLLGQHYLVLSEDMAPSLSKKNADSSTWLTSDLGTEAKKYGQKLAQSLSHLLSHVWSLLSFPLFFLTDCLISFMLITCATTKLVLTPTLWISYQLLPHLDMASDVRLLEDIEDNFDQNGLGIEI